MKISIAPLKWGDDALRPLLAWLLVVLVVVIFLILVLN
jgi:hypothetical protein